MNKVHDFNADFDWAESKASEDVCLLKEILPPLTVVQKADARLDKLGCDYVCTTLTFDEQREPHVQTCFFIDVKRRRRGAGKYWQRRAGQVVPELGLELGDGGGLLKTPRITNGLLFVFDPADCQFAIAVDFGELRQAALMNRKIWRRKYRTLIQHNQRDGKRYESEVTYVPLPAVEAAGVRTAKIFR